MATWRAATEAGKKSVKLTTNLTRMEVAKNPAHSLGVFYSKTLRALAKMPNDYPYRKYTEEVRDKERHVVRQIGCRLLSFLPPPSIPSGRSSTSALPW